MLEFIQNILHTMIQPANKLVIELLVADLRKTFEHSISQVKEFELKVGKLSLQETHEGQGADFKGLEEAVKGLRKEIVDIEDQFNKNMDSIEDELISLSNKAKSIQESISEVNIVQTEINRIPQVRA
jgi:predicted  nucleic acid-binding Zn-ribbon protein